VIPLAVAVLDKLGRVDARAAEFTGVHVDSRRVTPGDLFVAVARGEEFLGDALARGAAATLVPDDAFHALAEIARRVRELSSARVVGITGSMGKTSTKDILAALCAPSARTIAAEASFNNEIGVPLTLCRLERDTEVCILELAMRGPGQIAALAADARPNVGVITNIGPVHLELMESIDAIRRAKGELLTQVTRPVAQLGAPRGFEAPRRILEDHR
jgi:UDP-N-acetylmuramoyl-tripeptide--D-alanyl-D-alanine ligase